MAASVAGEAAIVRIISSRSLVFRCHHLNSASHKASQVIFTTKRQFSSDIAPERQESNSFEPRNLFEVFLNNPTLLNATKSKTDSSSLETVEKELKRREKSLRERPLRINPHIVKWKSNSKRVGAVGVKLGMTALWLKDGRRVPVTLIQIKDCQVIQARLSKKDGGSDPETELQIGAVNEPDIQKVKKTQYGHFKTVNVHPKKKVCSFPVSKNGLLEPGTQIHAAHFYPGQYVKVRGTTKDKGFQGVMKRWGMKGQSASHGQTKTHRKMGATGGGQEPGRIWPGKKMAGHMGNKNCTVFALKLYRINTRYNVLYVKGQVPGEKGGYLEVSDAWKKHENPPPFPTYFPDPEKPLPEDLFAEEVQQFTDDSISFTTSKKKK